LGSILEAQLKLIVSTIKVARKERLATAVVAAHKCNEFNVSLQKALKSTVWSTGCSSYFLTKDGFNPVNWPWTASYLRYRLRSFEANAADFIVTKCDEGEGNSLKGASSKL
jgi:hypothetical protein